MSSSGVRILISSLIALIFVAASNTPPTQFDENLRRLRSMPHKERALLAKNLERFDALPPERREAILDLDRRINELNPEQRSNYFSSLRYYYLWHSGLDQKNQEKLAAAGSDAERFALVTKLRTESGTSKSRDVALIGLPFGDLGSMPPIELGNLVRVWMSLTPEEKRKIESFPAVPRRVYELTSIGLQKKIERKVLPAEDQQTILKRLEAIPIYKSLVSGIRTRQDKAKNELKNAVATKKRFETRPQNLANPLNHLVESLYFVDHPPKLVEPANLARFETALPNWLRNTFDPLPASEARRRLSIVYREIYAYPDEMPVPKSAGKAEASKPKAATDTTGDPVAF